MALRLRPMCILTCIHVADTSVQDNWKLGTNQATADRGETIKSECEKAQFENLPETSGTRLQACEGRYKSSIRTLFFLSIF